MFAFFLRVVCWRVFFLGGGGGGGGGVGSVCNGCMLHTIIDEHCRGSHFEACCTCHHSGLYQRTGLSQPIWVEIEDAN